MRLVIVKKDGACLDFNVDTEQIAGVLIEDEEGISIHPSTAEDEILCILGARAPDENDAITAGLNAEENGGGEKLN